MHAPISRPAMVGRDSELGALRPFLDALADGPAALVFEGDAGIGKTALWSEGVRLGHQREYLVLSARPTEAEMQLPFAVLGDLLQGVPMQFVEALPEPQRRALDVAMLRVEPSGAAIERRALSLAVLSLLRELAVEAPVLLALDDLQWIDSPSAATLQFALRRIETERVGVLGTRRGRGGELPAGLPEALPVEQVRHLEIGPLDRDSLGQMLLERLRLPLAPPALHRLYRVSAGNPFFALEIARALERREVSLAPSEPFPVPQNLRELVRDRLNDLPSSAREVALVVAGLSQPTLDRVDAATASSNDEHDGLGQALAAGIVELEGDRVRFTHPLLGSIVYSEASPTKRRELHARLTGVTENDEERGRHLALAAPGPDATIASALDDAASTALRRGAPEAAAELLEHARRLTPTADDDDRRRRTLDAADCHLKAGDAKAARSLLSDLAVETPSGLARAHALLRLAGVLALEEDWRSMGDLYAEALLETDDPGVRGACENGFAWAQWFGGDLSAAVPHIRTAVSLAEQAGDRTRLAELLGEQAYLEGMLGEQRTDAILQRALRMADPAAPIRMLRQPQRWWTPLLMWADELEAAREVAYAERAKAVEFGDEHVLANVLDGLTDVERLSGNLVAAARLADEMHRAAQHTRQELIRAIALSKQGLTRALVGDVDEARARAKEGLEVAERLGFLQPKLGCLHALGFLELSLGRYDEAHRHLERAVAAANAAGIGEPGVLRFVPDDVEALVLLGRVQAAAAALDWFEERAAALGRRWALGAALRCRALLIDSTEKPSTALALVEQATERHAQISQPFELARTLLVQGQIQRRAKQRAAARATLERAHGLFETLGAPLWCERATRELARIGGRSRRASGLTETEERIAQLAANGRTNREIAADLFLSVNTVQAYLKRIYRELGVRSRTELARKLPPRSQANSTDSGVSAGARHS